MDFWDDLRVTLRTMRKNWRFNLFAIIIMASGLTTSIFLFALVNNTLTAPMPFDSDNNLRRIDLNLDGDKYHGENMSLYEFNAIRSATEDLWQTVSVYGRFTATMSTGRDFRQSKAVWVTPELFEIAQGKPLHGRLFDASDLKHDAEPTVILKELIWRDFFQAKPDVIGTRVQLNNQFYKIIGVLPNNFGFPHKAELWLPFNEAAQAANLGPEAGPAVSIYGLKKSSTSDSELNDTVQLTMSQLENDLKSQKGRSAFVRTFQEGLISGVSTLMRAMQIAVIFIFVLACVNISNLLFTRAVQRNKETAIRRAIGASFSRLTVQMVSEVVVIGIVSFAIAFAIVQMSMSYMAVKLPSIIPFEMPIWWQIALTGRDITIGVIFVLISIVLTSLFPVSQLFKNDIVSVVKDSNGGKAMSRNAMTRFIMVLELSLCTALIITSITLVFFINKSDDKTIGVNTQNILTANVSLPAAQYDEIAAVNAYFDGLSAQLQSNPSIEAVEYTGNLPLEWPWRPTFERDGQDYDPNAILPATNYVGVSQNFFGAMDINLVSGRLFNDFDKVNTSKVAVVSEGFAAKIWPNESPIDQRIKFPNDEDFYTIVGVVKNVTFGTLSQKNHVFPTAYVNLNQQKYRNLKILVKTSGDPYDAQAALLDAMQSLNVQVQPFNLTSMGDIFQRKDAGVQFISKLFSIFTVVALLLAFSGVYGVISSAVVNRSKDVGIRRALGSGEGLIYRLFFKELGGLFIIGAVIGSALGWFMLSKLAKSGMVTQDIQVYLFTNIFMFGLIALAIVVPVSRVLRTPPQSILRYE